MSATVIAPTSSVAVGQVGLRLAFLGRTSDEDAQDPSLSLPRQLRKCQEEAAQHNHSVMAHYWEVESSRTPLELRGTKSTDWSNFHVPIPRDGGLQELIRDASSGRFDGVIVESIDRVARMTADATRVEQELERAGVVLFAADEPMVTNATAILTRRVKQGVSEWYIRDLLERSRRGMEESVRQGWHTGGRAPYGYLLEQHDHPNPSKAREGKHKHRLIVDPKRAEVVLVIFEDYCTRLLGLGAICDKLNGNPERFLPPIPNRKDENGLAHTWSRGVVQAILRNPKYTGYNVWNRHDRRRGHPLIRPREEWVWSAEPTHPVIVPRELFDMVEERALRNGNAAKAGLPRQRRKGTPTTARRIYPLRGRVRCGLCGFRMEGSHQKGSNWYRCQYVYRRGPAAASIAGHPKVYGIKEDKILGPVLDFLARRVFGPDRLQLLRDELGAATASTWADHAAELKRLERELIKIGPALRNQTLRLEEHADPNHPIVALASERIVELTTRKRAIEGSIEGLKAQRPVGIDPDEIAAILDAVPDLRRTIANSTEADLAELFSAFEVDIIYDRETETLKLAAALTPELLPKLGNENEHDHPGGRSQDNGIAGAGFEPATFGL